MKAILDAYAPLRILMLTSVFPRWDGDATPPFVQNLCELMVKEGIEIVVVVPHSKGAALSEVRNGVRVKRHAYFWPLRLQKLCYEGGMLVNFKTRPWTKLLLPFFFLSQLLTTLAICLRFKPDLIHTHSLVPQGFTGVIVSRLLRIPHVTTSHGNDVFGLKPTGLMGWMKRSVLTRVDAVTVNSTATLAAVLEHVPELAEGRLHLIPAVPNEGAVNESLVDVIHQRYPGRKRILFVGRLIEEKGVFDLLEALNLLLIDDVELCALIVGDGSAKADLKRLIGSSSVADRIHLVGWQPEDSISSWMAAADVLVVPSKQVDGWQEAQGLVVVEAMAVGTPVVASNIGGIPDMIEDGQTGYLVGPGDVNQITQVLSTVINNSSGHWKVAEAARKRFCELFSASAVCAKTKSLYAVILSRYSQ